jgi:prophage tail gpP-like protein
MSDEVTLEIGNKKYEGWTSVTTEEAIDSIADGFSISGPNTFGNIAKPFKYEICRVTIGGQPIIKGRIDALSPEDNPDAQTLSIQGRSFAGQLVDCDIDDEGYEYSGLALSTIAKKLTRRFGITVHPANDTNPIEQASAEMGAKVGEYLQHLCAGFGLNLWSDSDGRLIIGYPPVQGKPVASIVAGEYPYLSGKADYDGTARFSSYKITGSDFGQPEIMGSALDTGVPIYRPQVAKFDDQSPTDPSNAAKRARAKALAAAVGCTINCEGWRDANGALWAKGATISVKIPVLMINTATAFIIAGVKRTLDASQGRKTTLRLMMPQTYQNTMPARYPWD